MSDQSTMTVRSWGLRCRDLAAAGSNGDLATETAKIMQAETVKAISEQRSVDGVKWPPRKVGSGPVLVNAAAHVTAKGVGNVAVITLEGPEVFHHYGAGRNPRRAILPSGGIGRLGDAIRRGIVAMCDDFMARSGRHDKGGGGKWKGGAK